MHDLVIRNGLVIDGSGAAGVEMDVAVSGERIAAIGPQLPAGRRELDARGQVVAPGWVDVHTHYDGQATWDDTLAPSSGHGVTTVVMGCCGVGFAPVKPQEREWVISLMEGVEDIPGAALTEGIRWSWESFPEYLDALARRSYTMDLGTHVPHGVVRAYVMGERGVANEAATDEDVARMREIVRGGLAAGAFGFSTSRTPIHKDSTGRIMPGTYATREELLGIAQVLGDAGRGVFQMSYNPMNLEGDLPWMREVAASTRRPLVFNIQQTDQAPHQWRTILEELERSQAAGIPLYGAVAPRPAGLLYTWESSLNPFMLHPSYRGIMMLPFAQKFAALSDPAFAEKLLAEAPLPGDEIALMLTRAFPRFFPLGAGGTTPEYEPEAQASVAAIAQRDGKSPWRVLYEAMMQDSGRGMVYFPVFNYAYGHFDHLRELLASPHTIPSLGDGGAHCGMICDASMPTYLVSHWARERSRGPRLPLEFVIKRQAADTARLYGLSDRGQLAPGLLADINIFDPARLALRMPHAVHDLPAQGRRLLQEAGGYAYTIKRGAITFENGAVTSARPGRLLRAGTTTA